MQLCNLRHPSSGGAFHNSRGQQWLSFLLVEALWVQSQSMLASSLSKHGNMQMDVSHPGQHTDLSNRKAGCYCIGETFQTGGKTHVNKNKHISLKNTSHFCTVTLHSSEIIWFTFLNLDSVHVDKKYRVCYYWQMTQRVQFTQFRGIFYHLSLPHSQMWQGLFHHSLWW